MKRVIRSKNSIGKEDFYQALFTQLKISTNLTKIQEKLNISKQQLNYYLRKLVIKGVIRRKGEGWYEVIDSSKNSIQYGSNLVKDLTRGHAYIWKAKITKIPENWKNRIELLNKSKINYKLVGAMKNIPRIKIYGRKVWLCDRFIKIWEMKNKSYYGETAKESESKAYDEIFTVIQALENKIGINLRPYLISVTRDHYALIKNDLAIYHNKNGEIVRISDKDGEWLLIDDSLEMGGELENIGKKSKHTHEVMKDWWNDHKKHNFEVTPSFTLNAINQVKKKKIILKKK